MQENRSFDSYFGTYPGADGIPKARRASRIPLRGGCSGRTTTARPQLRRPARPPRRGARHRRRQDERLHRAGRGRTPRLLQQAHRRARSARSRRRRPTSWATTTGARSRTTGRTRGTSCCRTTCSSPTPRGACPRTSTSSPAGRRSARGRGDPMSCVNAVQAPGSPPGEPQNTTGAVPDYAWTDLTYLLHKDARQLALLRLQGDAAGLRRQRDVLQGGAAEREDAGDLEPAAVVRHGASRTASARTSRRSTTSSRAARTGTLPAVSWLAPAQAVSEHPPRSSIARPGVRDRRRSTRSCAVRTGARRRSSSPGTTGAGSTTTCSRRRSTRTATGCACPGS